MSEYNSEITSYINKAKETLKKDVSNPSAQKVVFYGECAIRASRRNRKAEMQNLRQLVIGYSA